MTLTQALAKNMSNDIQQLESIIADTNSLINLAEEGEWNQLLELEKSRDNAIQHLFKAQPNIDPKVLEEGLVYILNKNKILTQYSVSQCDSVRMEMSKAGHAHKAIDSYLTSS